jgi:hypothetical protein
MARKKTSPGGAMSTKGRQAGSTEGGQAGRARQAARGRHSVRTEKARIYTLEVRHLAGAPAAPPADPDSEPAATIQVRGDQFLTDLHQALAETFDHGEEQTYEFHFGKQPLDAAGPRYLLPAAFDVSVEDGAPAAGRVDQTRIDSLSLQVGRSFGYLSDAGQDWWFEIRLADIKELTPKGKYPRVTKRPTPEAPVPQPAQEAGPEPLTGRAAADAACLIGEMHLGQGNYPGAVEAFTRAIDLSPTADAYEGRSRAYRELAAQDERTAQKLR